MKRVLIGCGVLAVLAVVAVGALWFVLGNALGSAAQRDYAQEFSELMLAESGLDAEGAVNGYASFEALLEASEALRSRYIEATPRDAAMVDAGLNVGDVSDGTQQIEDGRAMLADPALAELDALFEQVGRADAFMRTKDPGGVDLAGLMMSVSGSARTLARLEAARAIVHAHAGDELAAVEHLARLDLLSRGMMGWPLLISRATGTAIDMLLFEEVRRLAIVTDESSVLDALASLVEQAGDRPSLRYTLEGESITAQQTIQSLERPLTFIGRMSAAGHDDLEREVEAAIVWASLPPPERPADSPLSWAAGPRPNTVFMQTIAPAISGTLSFVDRTESIRGGTLALIRVRQFELLHGRIPESLAEVQSSGVGPIPSDWMHGGAYGYKPDPDAASGGQFTLYMFGMDGRDNGGAFDEGPMWSDGPGIDHNLMVETWDSP